MNFVNFGNENSVGNVCNDTEEKDKFQSQLLPAALNLPPAPLSLDRGSPLGFASFLYLPELQTCISIYFRFASFL